MARPAVGIKAVAEAAGVSVTTVSHALNGKGRLAPGTRDRIARIAEELGYRANATARNLVSGRSGLLGLAVSRPDSAPAAIADVPYFVELLSAATSASIEHGYALVLAGGGDALGGVALDGAIIVDPVPGDPLVADLLARRVPLVTAGRLPGPHRDAAPSVDNDHRSGTRRMLEHLAARGARRVALVTGPSGPSYIDDSLLAYREWCMDAGTAPAVAQVDDALSEAAAFAATSALLRGEDAPDAVFATIDRLALGALLAAQEHGLGVPGELLVAMSTDSEAGRRARPPITALNLQPQRIGRLAVETLVGLVDGREPAERHAVVPTRLISRGSTRRAAAPVS
jgi:DNA-binding LacI/PurR family transcriptional regulator